MPPDEMKWTNNPRKGTSIAVGFDGSENDDWTAIKCETQSGRIFTPRYGPNNLPTIWDPKAWGGRIPRHEVHIAVDDIFRKWNVRRMYCDPKDWQSDIGDWANEYGDEIVVEWSTFRTVQMHSALERFLTDLKTGRITQDGCPITTTHMKNIRKMAARGDKYIIGKPAGAYHQKIDSGVASVLAHEAAADAAAKGWETDESESISYAMYGFK